ncbi:MAG: alpha/beta hydrolase [Chitinophagaceae bacterium]|nr:alpha/beta hydrolase [Chitinophagaceae bacterium]
MAAEKKTYPFGQSIIHYTRFGTGPKPAICFHGYGEDCTSFSFLEKCAGNQYTFFAPDLPFHGNTDWKQGLNMTAEELTAIVKGILEENRPEYGWQALTLIGYSLGGRMVLSLYSQIYKQTDRLVLMAPDGLKVNFWYWLATQTSVGNRFFALTMKHPGWFFGLLKMLNKMKMVNTSIFKFVNYYIGDKEVRRLLYARWTTLRKIKPRLSAVKEHIRTNHTSVRLIYGKHDRIILSSVGEKFRRGIEASCTISIIPSGHRILHENHAEGILPALLH